MNQAGNPMIGTIISIVIIAIVLGFRMRRLTKEKPLHLGALWIVPGIYALITAYLYSTMPPKGIGWLWCGAALLLGAALGWQRGRMMHISVDPETETLKQKGSLAAMLFLLGLIAIRTVARIEGEAWHLDVLLITDALVAFALGLLTLQRVEMYLRAKKLLEAARGTRPA